MVAIHPKQADVAAWLRYRCWGAPGGSRRFWTHLLGSIAALLALAHLLLGRWSPWGATAAGIGVALALFPWRRWFGASAAAKRATREQPEYLRAYQCLATPKGMVLEGAGETLIVPWSGFTALIAAEQHLFFERGDRALILPRRDFESPAASQQFFHLCEAYWQPIAGPLQQPAASTRVMPGEYQTRLSFEVRAEDLPALREAVVRARARTLLRWLNRNPRAGIELLLFLTATPALGWEYGGASLFTGTVVALACCIGAGTWWWDRSMARKCPQPGEQEITLSPRGVILEHADGQTYCFNWSALDQVVCTAHCVLFQSRRGTSIGIPERVFQDRAELQRFLDCAREWHANTPDAVPYPRPT